MSTSILSPKLWQKSLESFLPTNDSGTWQDPWGFHHHFIYEGSRQSFSFRFLVPYFGALGPLPSTLWCDQQNNPLFSSLQKPFPHSWQKGFPPFNFILVCCLFPVHAVRDETVVKQELDSDRSIMLLIKLVQTCNYDACSSIFFARILAKSVTE